MRIYTKNTYYNMMNENLIYQNYHKHSLYTNPIVIDSCAYPEEYAVRASNLGHTILSSCEHGYQGRYIESYELSKQCFNYNKNDEKCKNCSRAVGSCERSSKPLKFLFSVEAYFVWNRFEKDNTNAHIVLCAKNENGRKAINRILSEANMTGYYYRARIDYKLLMELPENDVWICTACLGGINKYTKDNNKSEELLNLWTSESDKYNSPYEMLVDKIHNKFGDNFYLEVQAHNTLQQKELNNQIINLSKKYNIEIIAGVDSHYIYESDAWKRDYLQKSSGIFMEEEQGWFMDYPDGKTLFNRFKNQGILSDDEILIAISNTNVFLDVEEYDSPIFNYEMKMPSALKYRNYTKEEKEMELVRIVKSQWEKMKNTIPEEKHQYYLREIAKELDIIFKINHADYFLANYEIIKDAVENRGGMITFSGRGCSISGVLVPTEKTLKTIENIEKGDKVISSDGKFHEVLETFTYDIEEELIQIIHEYGTNKYHPLIYTTEHKILVHRNNVNQWIDAEYLTNKDYVCVPKIKLEDKTEEYIDLNKYNIYGFDYDNEYIYEYNSNIGKSYKYSPSDVAKNIGCGKSLIENLANGKINSIGHKKKELKDKFFEYVPFNTFREYQEYIKNIRTKKIKRFIKNNYDYNVFIGLLYGDGCHREDKHTVSLSINSETKKDKINRKYFEQFCDYMGFDIYELKSKNKKLIQLFFTSLVYSEYMKQELFSSKKDKEKMFNHKLFYQNKNNLKGLKYGLWLSDGSDKDDRISFDNTSMSLINAYKILSLICEDCGICYITKRVKHLDNRGYHSKDSYKLRYPKNPFTTGRGHHAILQDENFWYLKIKEIKRLPKQKVSVYDISVENTHNYLANNMIAHNSGPSFIVNHLLGFTQIDRISSPITLYPERFLSTSRMSAGSLADIDFNCGNTPVFEDSQKMVMGEYNAYPMIAFGTQKPKAAWKMFCRAVDVPFEIANEISSKIDEYETDLKYWDEDSGEEEPNVYDYIPEDLREYFDQSKEFLGIINSASRHPCFIGETLVNTENGYKQIKDIKIGEKVLSHDGEYHEVLQTMCNQSDDLYELRTSYCEKIVGTGNHPFYVITKYKNKVISKKGNKSFRNVYTKPFWKDFKDLDKNDLIGIPVNTESKIPSINGLSDELLSNPNFWWIIGRFVGDGWIEECNRENKIEKRIKICCSKKDDIEKYEIEEKIKELFLYRIEEKETVCLFYILSNLSLFNYLKEFGKYANNKKIPLSVINLPVPLLKSFLDGYISADGYCPNNSIITFSTVGEVLYYQLSECFMKVFKCPVLLSIREGQEYFIDGRKVLGKKQYRARIYPNAKEDLRQNFYKDGYIWVKIKNKKKLNIQKNVYNFSVNETNTYNVYNHIVHNCGNILYSEDIREEFGIVRLKSKGGRETIVACCDGKWIEKHLMLKNDLLTVACVKLNYLLYKRVGIPYMSLNKLLEECREHKEVWDVYEKGYVIGLNQVEKPSTKRKLMKYKPKNISELSALIAGIRPAFKSLIDKLINREHFEYGIPTLDKLLQTEELPESFILYQEQIMKILSFAGIPMGDCYTVIKSISKKRFAKIMHYKEQFLKGMARKLIEEEGVSNERADEVANTIWGIIEDASAYGFNSSHSLSVSFDSLLATYFKALYPIEFYEVYLNLQMERADKAKALLATKEMKEAFNIKLLPMRFGQDNRKYTAYKEQNALSNCLKSIKGFGDIVGSEMFRLSKHKYDSFLDLLATKVDYVKFYPLEVWNDFVSNNNVDDKYDKEIRECINIYLKEKDNPEFLIDKKRVNLQNVFSLSSIENLYEIFELSKPLWKIKVNDTQIETLIMLNYFEEFGNNNKLLEEFKMFCNYYDRVQINKEKINDSGLNFDIFLKYVKKETKSLYKDIDFIGYIKEISQSIPNQYVALPLQLKFERELLEFPIYQNKLLPKTWYYVLGFKTYGDKINTPYLILYNLNDASIVNCQVNSSKVFRDEPFGIYSIINVKKMEDIPKKKKVGEKKYIITNELKTVVKEYEVVYRDKNQEVNEVLNNE